MSRHPDSTAAAPAVCDHGVCFDCIHVAQVAGMDMIPRDLIERLAEQRAHELIHERSLEMLGMARHYAAQKGPAWLAMIEDAAAQPWEVDA